MILVTGGLGYIGSHTVVELMQQGFEVLVADDLSNSKIEVLNGIEAIVGKKPEFIKLDLKDKAKTKEQLADQDLEGCIHFAAYKSVGESEKEPLKYYVNNLGSVVNVLELGIPNFIFSSSCTVYGQADELPINENAPLKTPESVYGKTKQMGEVIVEDYANLLNHQAIILRYFNPIGAHPSAEIGELPLGVPNNLVPYVSQTAAGIREQLSIFGNDYPTPDGTAIRDYIYVVDLAKAHVNALQQLIDNKQTEAVSIFNLGTGKGNSVLEVVNTFEKANEVKVPYVFAPRREGDITSAFANADKAEKELGWQAEVGLEDALKTAWNWQKKILKNEN